MKGTPWEGGSRTVALIWSTGLQRRRRVSYQLMHISDWLPTLYSAAGKHYSPLVSDTVSSLSEANLSYTNGLTGDTEARKYVFPVRAFY